jgi:hypothetical protein
LMGFVPKRRQVDAGAVSSAIAEFLKEASGRKLGR